MKIETKCLHAGYEPKNGEPLVMPIYQSTTFKYDSSDHLADLFDQKVMGHMYSRITNPTVSFVEQKIAALENGADAVLTSSGQAAIMLAFFNICKAGDHILSSTSIYGGTVNLFQNTFKRFGIDVTFFNPDDSEENIQKLFRAETRVYYGETIANPTLNIFDVEKHARIAHKNGVPLIVDNTLATPILCRPIDFGADLLIHSTTKYMDGFATVVGGAVVDSGKFDWTNGKFPEFTEPDESYHGTVYSRDYGNLAYTAKARFQLMRDLGIIPSAQSVFVLNTGLGSLHVRMERHSQNALAAAEYLEVHAQVEEVMYPGLKSSRYHELSKKYMPDGQSGVVTFRIKGGRKAAQVFMDSLQLAKIVVHVADARTIVIHPASTTHRQLTDEQLIESGVTPDMIRLSVGIENIEDILADLAQAFERIK